MRCGWPSASARWPRSNASVPVCPRHGWRCTIPGRCGHWSRCYVVATYVAAGGEHMMRTEAAFDWNGVLSPANVRVDAWVTPPLYTSKPPIILSAANKEAAPVAGRPGPLPVPAGATLIVRSSGGALDVVGRRRRDRSRADRTGAARHQREAFHHCRRWHRTCPRAVRPAAMEVQRDHRPCADHRARQGSGTSGARFAANVLQDRGRLRRHRSAGAFRRASGRTAERRGRTAAAVRSAAILAGASECANPQWRRSDRQGSQRGSLCRRRRHADPDGKGRGRQ